MVVKGVKIEFIDATLIRRMSRFIVCDPSVAKVYVSKGLAKYIDEEILPVKKEEPDIEVESKKVEVKKEPSKEENKPDVIFPSNIIGD